MYNRINTHPVFVGNVQIGGNDNIVIQSMCDIKTSKVDEVVNQIKRLQEYGCQIVRLSILDESDANAILKIKSKVSIPLVADIHFDYKLALLAIENGIDKIRINPGNIGREENVVKVINACKEKNVPIRIGVNSGSLEKDILKEYGICAKAMILSASRHIDILEKYNFHNYVLSLKSSDYKISNEAYLMASQLFDCPLHIGITEPGPLIPGIIKSTLGLSSLIDKGIGSTIRISLSDDPVNEIKVAKQLLAAKGYIKMPSLTSCPTCGRTMINLIKYVNEIEDYLYKINKDIKVAIMGCVVNGPGEASDADIGVAGGNKVAVLFKKGQIVKTIKEEEIVRELINEINKM